MYRKIGSIIVIGVVFISMIYTHTGCISSTENTTEKNAYTLCENPRPEICTQEYDPVCGKLLDGEIKTFSNACSACSDENVIKYKTGSCDLIE